MITLQENISLAPFTVFKVGGLAKYFAAVKNSEEVAEAVKWAREKNLPFFALGLGSNILVSDKGFEGLVVKMELRDIRLLEEKERGAGLPAVALVRAEAGVSMAELVAWTLAKGLAGFEWGIGVPGTVGGSVRGNAGCFGKEMKDVIESVEVLDSSTAATYNLQAAACAFSYRESVFKKRPELIALSATLSFEGGDVQEARKRLAEYTKRRIESQDIGAKTAGSVFKNVRWGGEMPEGMKFAGSGPKENAAVGYLLESAGLKGFETGGAKFSEKHANFILNTGGATADGIVQLIALAKERVFEQFGVRLEEEIQYVGF